MTLHLAHLGIDLTRYWGDYLSALAIAKFVNQHHNHLPENVAMGFAGNDFKVYTERLATFSAHVQAQITASVNELINDVWLHPRFNHALEAVANALLHRRRLTAGEVAAVIESRIGADMRTAAPEPTEGHTRYSAFVRHTRRVAANEAGDQDSDWYEAERGMRFALASQP